MQLGVGHRRPARRSATSSGPRTAGACGSTPARRRRRSTTGCPARARPGPVPESAASSSLHVHDGLLNPTRASIEQKFYERKFAMADLLSGAARPPTGRPPSAAPMPPHPRRRSCSTAAVEQPRRRPPRSPSATASLPRQRSAVAEVPDGVQRQAGAGERLERLTQRPGQRPVARRDGDLAGAHGDERPARPGAGEQLRSAASRRRDGDHVRRCRRPPRTPARTRRATAGVASGPAMKWASASATLPSDPSR